MRLATIRTADGTRAVRVDEDAAVELGPADLSGAAAAPRLAGGGRRRRRAAARARRRWTTRRRCRSPEKIVCVGLNYRTHILEMGRELPEYPTLFAKFARALVGAYDPVVLPAGSTQVDWEAELGVVIGAEVRHADAEQAARRDRRLHRGQRRHRPRLPVPHPAVAAGQDVRALAPRSGRGWSPTRDARARSPASSTATWCRRPTPLTSCSTPPRWSHTSRDHHAGAGRPHRHRHPRRRRARPQAPALPRPGSELVTRVEGVGECRNTCRRGVTHAHRGRRRRARRAVPRRADPQADPSIEVTVFERNRADDTFGFGVVFSDRTLAGIHEADPVLREALARRTAGTGTPSRCGSRASGCAAAATAWPRSRAGRCSRCCRTAPADSAPTCGSPPRHGSPTWTGTTSWSPPTAPARGSARSSSRAFGSTVETATAKFIWFGTDYLFDGLTFVHERGPHGVFAVHGYPISADVEHVHRGDRRGVLARRRPRRVRRHAAARAERREDPRRTWRSCSPSRSTGTSCWSTTPGGATSAPAAPRAGPRWTPARWRCSATPRTPRTSRSAPAPRWRWRTRSRCPRALVAHPGDLPAALAAYEAAARPSVERIQGSARPSLSWWEHFGRYHDAFEPWQFAYHFLSRSITDARLARRDPASSRPPTTRWRRAHGAEPLDHPAAGRRGGRSPDGSWPEVPGRSRASRGARRRDEPAGHRARGGWPTSSPTERNSSRCTAARRSPARWCASRCGWCTAGPRCSSTPTSTATGR